MVDFSDPGSQALSSPVSLSVFAVLCSASGNIRCPRKLPSVYGPRRVARESSQGSVSFHRASSATQHKATLPRHFLSESPNLARCNTSFQSRRKNTNATNSDNKTNMLRRKPIPNSCLIKMVKLEDPVTLAISPPSTLTSRAPLSIPALNVEGESGSLSSMID